MNVKYNSSQDYKISVNDGEDMIVTGSLLKKNGNYQLSCCVDGHLSRSSVAVSEKNLFLFNEVKSTLIKV